MPRYRGDEIPSISDYSHHNEEAAAVWYAENRYDMMYAGEPMDDDPYDDYDDYEEEEDEEDSDPDDDTDPAGVPIEGPAEDPGGTRDGRHDPLRDGGDNDCRT